MPVPPLPPADLEEVLRAAAGLWPEFKGARILFTGATGFFGRWMLESLFEADRRFGLGVRVAAWSRDPERFLHGSAHFRAYPGLHWHRGTGPELSQAALADFSPEYAVHLATEADMDRTQNDPAAAYEAIAGATRKVLQAARGAGVRRFLFTSSGAVYGRPPAIPSRLDEEFPGRPNPASGEPYDIGGEAKLRAEQACLEASAPDFAPVIARGFSFAGPGLPMDGKFAFGNFLRDALAGRRIVVTGDGTPIRSYLYPSDLAVWLWTMLLRGRPGRAYNLGSESEVSLGALAEAIDRRAGGGGIEIRKQPAPGDPVHRYVPSTRRAREELGLAETVGLGEIIRRTAVWQRSAV